MHDVVPRSILFSRLHLLGHRHPPYHRRVQQHALAVLRESSLEETEVAEQPAVPTEFVEVGVVGAPHGVRGEVKVQPLTDFPQDRLGTPGTR